jgi:glucan 1,3-beta-glucosidase
MVGDALNLPVLKGTSTLGGIGLLDSDVYIPNGYGNEWYQNQNNFYRQVRNFVIDLTEAPKGAAGIHWQVAQATSLQNIKFVMRPKTESGNKQQGVCFPVCCELGRGKLTTRRSLWRTVVAGS